MVLDRGIEFEDSASKHGYTLDDVLYAMKHVQEMRRYTYKGTHYARFIGAYHGNSLVQSIEVIMRLDRTSGNIHVFHVNALTDGFMDRT